MNKDSTNPANYEGGNCLYNCPNEYPYEYTKENNIVVCLQALPDGYSYELKDGSKSYIDDCSKISKFFDGNKCVDECKRKDSSGNVYYIYYYIKDGKKYCIDSCLSVENESGFKHSLESKNSHQICIENCPASSNYYFEDNYTCLDNCLYGYVDTDNNGKETNKCLHSCFTSNSGNNKHIINGNICSKTCTDEEPFAIIRNDGTIKCTTSCEKDDSELKYYSINEFDEKYICLKTCSKKIFGKKCLDQCPDGMSEELNKCITKCEKPYFVNWRMCR